MQNTAIQQVYGAAAATLIDQFEFLIERQTGLTPSSWDLMPLVVGDQTVQTLIPVPSTVPEKEAFRALNTELAFRKAVQRTTEAMSHVGMSGEDLPELWRVAKAFVNPVSPSSLS